MINNKNDIKFFSWKMMGYFPSDDGKPLAYAHWIVCG